MRILLSLLLLPLLSHAYPDFISYGYRTCITCHYNGQGGGALNDYGRAVWASEITAKTFTGRTSDDELAERSGFLGKRELPWYIRPGLKYRGLYVVAPFGSSEQVERWIHMQGEANVAIHLDKRQEKVIVASYGYMPTPQRFSTSTEEKPENWLSREYYLRWQLEKKQYLYVGLMDKFYGIKHPDHTAFNRNLTRNSMNDQTHGVAYQYFADKYDFVGHLFLGNLSQEEELRQKGASFIYEYAVAKPFTVGATAQWLDNKFLDQKNVAFISRLSFEKGKSFLLELGLRDDLNKTSNDNTFGYYSYLQGVILIKRGYNLLTTYQSAKTELTSSSPIRHRITVGGLFFPYPKTEFRFEAVNSRTASPGNTSSDQWSVLGQVHFAL